MRLEQNHVLPLTPLGRPRRSVARVPKVLRAWPWMRLCRSHRQRSERGGGYGPGPSPAQKVRVKEWDKENSCLYAESNGNTSGMTLGARLARAAVIQINTAKRGIPSEPR